MAARLLVLLLACFLQIRQLGLDRRFDPDEAHFMTFARDAAVKGDWMLPGALDKPPAIDLSQRLGSMVLSLASARMPAACCNSIRSSANSPDARPMSCWRS